MSNLSDFNQNPACAGFGPSAEPSEPFRTVQLAVMGILCFTIVVGAVLTLYVRRFRRRIRIRSPLPIFLGSIGGLSLFLIRSYYNYIGREHFSCTFDVTLFYLLFPLVVMSESIAGAVFLAKQFQRQKLTAATIQALEKKLQEKEFKDERRYATIREFFEGLWDFILSLFELISCVTIDSKYYYHQIRKPSIYRETFYELLVVLLLSLSFIIALGIRISSTPHYQPQNGCTGCIIQWVDVVIVLVFMGTLFGPLASLTYKVRKFNIPDPLKFLTDIYRSAFIGFPILILSCILLATDPNNAMKNQRMDWHLIAFIVVWGLHFQRTTIQLLRVRRIQKLAERRVNLIDILSDPAAELLFEKHLIAELANENLLFWREGIKYKRSFDQKGDFDYAQQMAKVLWRTFLSPHASLPINISDSIKKTINARFKGVVGKGVFDEALVEVYLMMQNGAFQRFLHSEPFKNYVYSKADFSMSAIEDSPDSIVPSSGDGVTTTFNMDINDYIQSI